MGDKVFSGYTYSTIGNVTTKSLIGGGSTIETMISKNTSIIAGVKVKLENGISVTTDGHQVTTKQITKVGYKFGIPVTPHLIDSSTVTC